MIIPTIVVGSLVILWRLLDFYASRDDPGIETANAVQDDVKEVYAEQKKDYLPFSEEARRDEVASLLNSVNQLTETLSQAEGPAVAQGEAADRREAAERSIAALAEANQDNWAELRAKARADLQAYAESLADRVGGSQ